MTSFTSSLKLPTYLFSTTWGSEVIAPKQERVKDLENRLPTSSAETDRIRIQEKRKVDLTPVDVSLTTRRNEISTDNRWLIHQLASGLNLALDSVSRYLISTNPLILLDFREKDTKLIIFFVSLSFPTDKLTIQV